MMRRLLVGVAHASEVNEPREHLLHLLRSVAAREVEVQALLVEDGPLRTALEDVADVRVLPELLGSGGRPPSPSRRGRHARELRRWVRTPDHVYLDGPLAVSLLRWLPAVEAPVTVHVHPWDFWVPGLEPEDRDLLLARTDRFLVTHDSVAIDLASSGATPEQIDLLTGPPTFPEPPTARPPGVTRADLHLGSDEVVVAVPPVEDWADEPDLTLAVAWMVERLGGTGTVRFLWFGMPDGGDQRWPVDLEIRQMHLSSVHVVDDHLAWHEVLALADVVMLPIRTTGTYADDFAEAAALEGIPLLCWEGHPAADDVSEWGGAVIPRGDVATMALRLWAFGRDAAQLRRARLASWRRGLGDLERFVPDLVSLP